MLTRININAINIVSNLRVNDNSNFLLGPLAWYWWQIIEGTDEVLVKVNRLLPKLCFGFLGRIFVCSCCSDATDCTPAFAVDPVHLVILVRINFCWIYCPCHLDIFVRLSPSYLPLCFGFLGGIFVCSSCSDATDCTPAFAVDPVDLLILVLPSPVFVFSFTCSLHIFFSSNLRLE
jgi:hypothetical protein